jgi:death-on-curing protein
MEVIFLTRENVLTIHADLLFHFGGSPGIRDEGLLDSALAMPAAGFGDQLLHPDVPSMAAAYLFHLVKNHPFVDGNKRIGAMTAFVFLKINGLDLTLDEDAYEATVWSVATDEIGKDELIDLFRKSTMPR